MTRDNSPETGQFIVITIRRPLRMMIPPNQVDLVDTRAIDDVDAGAIDTAGTNAVVDLRRLSEPP